MEEKFILAWEKAREKALTLGVRMRPVERADAIKQAHRILTGRRLSDGFADLKKQNHLELSLEALAVDSRFTSLFSDEEANEALTRLLESGYYLG